MNTWFKQTVMRLRAWLSSLTRRSFVTHNSVRVTDVSRALAFYRQLGFHQVTATRANEVLLLRNHCGNELNLVAGNLEEDNSGNNHAVFQLERLTTDLPCALPEIREDATTRRVCFEDPDGNTVEFFEHLDDSEIRPAQLYHIATQAELAAGLGDHYYMPPDAENRFVRARARSAFMILACNRVAAATQSTPMVVELDEALVTLEPQLVDEADSDSSASPDTSSYPHVNSPLPRDALTVAGTCEHHDDNYSWPNTFVSIESASA